MDFQEQLFKAIEVVVDGKIKELSTDSYIECIIKTGKQEANGSYVVLYRDTVLEAFPISNSKYEKGDIVYVMAIGGDLSKKKVILTQKGKSGEQYVNLANIKPLESKMGKNYAKPVDPIILPSGTKEVNFELLSDFIEDMVNQTNIVISADIESNLEPIVGGDYGISITVLYEDGISRDYRLSLNRITGNIYHTSGYHDTVANLCLTSKAIKITSSKVFITGFDSLLVNNYLKFSSIKIGFLDKAIAEIIDSVVYRVDIASSNGLVFKNNGGYTTLTANLYKGNDIADASESLKYAWTRRDNLGESIDFNGGMPVKFGRELIVEGISILSANTFIVTVIDPITETVITSGFSTLANVNDGPIGPKGKDTNLLDWVKEWDDNKVKINDNSILSPRIFAGVNEGTSNLPLLTGLALGRDVLGAGDVVKGLVVYSRNIPTIQIRTDGWAIFGTEEGRQFIIRPDGSIVTPRISVGDTDSSFEQDLGLLWLKDYMSFAITYGLDDQKPRLR